MRSTAGDRLRTVEEWLQRLYIAAEGTSLRREEKQKAIEVTALLDEVARMIGRVARRSPVLLVDAAAGKSYVGLLAARLVLEPMGRRARIITLERDARRCELARRAAAILESETPLEFMEADVSDPRVWPNEPSIVTALHACGPAADAVIAGTIASRARALLLVPCCTARTVADAARAACRADAEGFPRHSPVRRRFIQAWVDAIRTLNLEAAGYETEVVEFVPPTITPHNLLWRARRVGETHRMRAARSALEQMPY